MSNTGRLQTGVHVLMQLMSTPFVTFRSCGNSWKRETHERQILSLSPLFYVEISEGKADAFFCQRSSFKCLPLAPSFIFQGVLI